MLIWVFVFVICLQALKVSCKRSVNQRGKKGEEGKPTTSAICDLYLFPDAASRFMEQ